MVPAAQLPSSPMSPPATSSLPATTYSVLVNGATQEHLAFIEDLLSRRYELYSWCEAKINTLSTVNSILLGVLVGLTGAVLKPAGLVSALLLALAGCCVLTSLLVVLWHIIPSMRSGKNPKAERSIRSVYGVSRYPTREEYIQSVLAADLPTRFLTAAYQVYGMNKNIMDNQRAIRWAVFADFGGLAAYIAFAGVAYFLKA